MGKRGERIARGAHGRTMRRKNDGWFWSDETEDLFFDHLAASCNVTAAAEAVGFCTPTVYRLRRTKPGFAERWKVALEQGYAKLEMALLQAANDTLEGKPLDESLPTPKMTVEQAMNVLRAHRNEVSGNGRGPGVRARRRSLDEVRGSIMKKVEAIRNGEREERREKAGAARARKRVSDDLAPAAEGETGDADRGAEPRGG